ncbi:non-canonical purine NTP pyrophosphatase [bacterium]|nr:MAG: non-canonical purine NTP pyrophosphatase [bacterium]
MTILLATTSQHKAGEIAAMLSGVPDLQLQTLNDFPATEAPEEDGATMADNARIKAEFYSQHFGVRVLADDSGLEVDALNGEPGVHSARWSEGSDSDRMLAILDRMIDVPVEERGARYRCTLCLATPDGIEWEAEGVCEGEIALEARGTGGFGYDPIFGITLATGADSEYVGKTGGEVSPEVKATVSHRARAVRQFVEYLKTR